jgi:M6 family metalloprotease-like protein
MLVKSRSLLVDIAILAVSAALPGPAHGQVRAEGGTVHAIDEAGPAHLRFITDVRVTLPGVRDASTSLAEPALTTCGRSYEDIIGSKSYVILFMKFSDISTEPACPQPNPDCWDYFDRMFGSASPNLNEYWDEASYSNFTISGAYAVPQWYELPLPRSSYVDASTDEPDLELMVDDATAVADADVDFRDYDGILLVFNGAFLSNKGRKCTMTLDGLTRKWGVMYFRMPIGNLEFDVVAHEMGHSLGMPMHSCDGVTGYGSRWDVVSAVGHDLPLDCQHSDSGLGCLPVDPIAYHRDQCGWLAPSQLITAPAMTTRVVTLERTTQPPASGFLLAKMLIGGDANHFYTVEARRGVGYDIDIPGDAVLIHHAKTSPVVDSLYCDAIVVDADGDSDVNDDGAMWLPGETFHDQDNHVMVSVLDESGTGWLVGLSTAPRAPCYVDGSNAGTEDGTVTHPFDTVVEGLAGVVPGARILAFPGDYPEALVIRKPCRIERAGPSGSVFVGR